MGTRVDPTLTRADRLVGQVLGLKGNLPDVFTEVKGRMSTLVRVVREIPESVAPFTVLETPLIGIPHFGGVLY